MSFKKNTSLILVSLFLMGFAYAAAPPSYRLLKEIPIPHKDGGWDYVSVDEAAARLYLAQATRVVVVDLSRLSNFWFRACQGVRTQA